MWLQVQGAVRALLTPYLYRRLADAMEHVELLTVLTSERTSPLVVWTPAMRTQLRGMLSAHSDAQPVTADAIEALAAFRYTEVEHELVVEEVYVRLFVEVRSGGSSAAEARMDVSTLHPGRPHLNRSDVLAGCVWVNAGVVLAGPGLQ